MRDHFAAENAPEEFQQALRDAAGAFESNATLMQDVRAGYAAARVAHEAAQTLETDPAAVRDAYRSMLREERNFGQLFDSLAKFDLGKNFTAVIDTFLAAAGADLNSAGPSVDSRFLGALLTELGKLKRLKSVLSMSDAAVARCARLIPEKWRAKMDSRDMTSRMLHFAAKATVNLSDAQALCEPIEQAGLVSQIVFANEIVNLHAAIPDEIFPNGARIQQTIVLSTLRANLADAEERAFADGAAAAAN